MRWRCCMGMSDPAVEGLIDAARGCVDGARREGLYRRCDWLLQDDPAWLTLYTHRKAAAGAPVPVFREDGVLGVRSMWVSFEIGMKESRVFVGQAAGFLTKVGIRPGE